MVDGPAAPEAADVKTRPKFFDPDRNPTWYWCCCGCLPIISLFKTLVIIFPCLLIALLAGGARCIWHLPYATYAMYKTNFQTRIIGPNLKVLFAFILPFGILTAPFLIVMLLCIISLGLSIYIPMEATFNPKKPVCDGYKTPITSTWDMTKQVTESNKKFLEDLKRYREVEVENPFDIPVALLMMCIFVAVSCLMIEAFLFGMPALVKSPFSIYKALKTYCIKGNKSLNGTKTDRAMKIPFFILGFVFVPAAVLVATALTFVMGMGFGASCSSTTYRYKSISAGFKEMMNGAHELDSRTNMALFNRSWSCFCTYELEKQQEARAVGAVPRLEGQNGVA
mmetsp:Transcript_13963/g.15414  ORF Transcript_13963/g.15414 Transcript_13963/m.15414 type:complete len:338 (-) Transcript_13963:113-1126(-)